MHPDLSEHLHTAECNELIKQLRECHSTYKFGKFFGSCTELDSALNRCLKKEREENRRRNAEKASLKRAEIRSKMKEN